MLTSEDIKLLVDSFKVRQEADADKEELKRDIQKLRKDIRAEMHELHSEVMEKLDAILSDLKEMKSKQVKTDQRLDRLESTAPPA